jgi:hypothetical protein
MVALEALGPAEESDEHEAIDIAPEILNNHAGDYRIVGGPSAGAIRSLVFEEGSLYYDQGGGGRARLFPRADGAFFFKGKTSVITFETDEEGRVTHMILHQGGMGEGRRVLFERVR